MSSSCGLLFVDKDRPLFCLIEKSGSLADSGCVSRLGNTPPLPLPEADFSFFPWYVLHGLNECIYVSPLNVICPGARRDEKLSYFNDASK